MLRYTSDRFRRVLLISRRELRVLVRRPLLIFCMLIAPVFTAFLMTSIMRNGLPTDMPAGLVDEDDTQTTRSLIRIWDAMESTDVRYRYTSFSEARKAMQRGEIYAFLYIPKGTTHDAISSRRPKISFYTCDTYFVPASLLMKELTTLSELSGMAVTRETLSAKGLSYSQILGVIQPIVIEAHPLNNPYLNYSVLLNNLIIPGIIIILIMLTTSYTIGLEWKMGSQKHLLDLAGGSVPVALTGKLLPQLVVYSIVLFFVHVYFYEVQLFPCKNGLFSMMCLGVLTILVAQALGLFIFGILVGQMRMAMSICALWGVLSIPMAGFSFPTTAMTPLLQTISWAFPLRDYFLIYVNQALDGYSIVYAWKPVTAMLVFLLLPFLVLWRYRQGFAHIEYKP